MKKTKRNEDNEGNEHADIATMSFEKALAELEQIVSSLERGDVELEQSIRIYERGEMLKTHCARLLSTAEERIEKLRLSKEGKLEGVEPLDSQQG